ncbi:MAG: DUF58 domain-containing protein [Verrucomicrobiales bacterium]|nr:DUF58 domain-containing protein [Verrucomicrobiales bacterium]
MNPSPPVAASSGGRSFVDAKTLMSLRSLELRARVVVEGFWSGLHRSPYHGFSVEFTEYRQYVPGDDPRYLDWRVFGRSDRYYIKKFEDETNLRCHLIVDQSRSMTFGSIGHSKAEYAATLAGTLAYFLHRQGDATGLLSFDERVRDYLPARHRSSHLRQLLLALERPAGGQATDLVSPLRHLAEIVRKRGLMVLISDFLAPLDALDRSLAALVAGGHEVVAFQILDPSEVDFGFDRQAMFEDLESGQTLFIDPTVARRDYIPRFQAHEEDLRRRCQNHGAPLHRLLTREPLYFALLAFLQERARRGRQVRHRVAHDGRAIA